MMPAISGDDALVPSTSSQPRKASRQRGVVDRQAPRDRRDVAVGAAVAGRVGLAHPPCRSTPSSPSRRTPRPSRSSPGGRSTDRASVVPPTAMTLGELAGKLAGRSRSRRSRRPPSRPGGRSAAVGVSVPVSSIRPKEWLVTVAPWSTAACSAWKRELSVGRFASTRTMWQVGQAVGDHLQVEGGLDSPPEVLLRVVAGLAVLVDLREAATRSSCRPSGRTAAR